MSNSNNTSDNNTTSVKQFVKAVAEQDYATANRHLTQSINDKLKNKIAQLKNINIFKDK